MKSKGLRAGEFQEAPENVLEEIAAFCTDRSVVMLSRTCRRMRTICQREIAARPPPSGWASDEEARSWLTSPTRTSQDLAFKTVFLGADSVGKTSLLLFKRNGHAPAGVLPTIGAAFFTEVIPMFGVSGKLEIWDTAGQERYHSLAPMYYRNAAVVVVMYDVTDVQSFEQAKRWAAEIEEMVDSVGPMVLVGNKVDLTRKVKKDEVEVWARGKNVPHFETSASSGIGVKELFEFLAMRAAAFRCRLPSADHDPFEAKQKRCAIQ